MSDPKALIQQVREVLEYEGYDETCTPIEALDRLSAHMEAQEARVKELEEACRKAEGWLWDPDENQLDQFERIAEEYYRATLHMRPGKDSRTEDTNSEENRKRFQEWCHGRNREVLASLRFALPAAPDKE